MEIVKQIEALMKKHRLTERYLSGAATAEVEEGATEFVLTFGDLPQLTFFIELASLCAVPLETIKTESDSSYGGCETCGYGSGDTITVRVPKP